MERAVQNLYSNQGAMRAIEEEAELMGMTPPAGLKFYRGEGCSDCFNTEYRGRTAVFEILEMNPAMRRAIHARSLKDLERTAADTHFRPLIDNCRQLVLDGVTSAEEVHRVLGGE